jgi:hypothetical protein
MRADWVLFVQKLKKNKKYITLKDLFNDMPIYDMPLDKLMEEVETLHKQRKIRRLDSTDHLFLDKVVEANVQDQSVRARITEIMLLCLKASSSLSTAIEALQYHLLLEYGEELKSFRTKEERLRLVQISLKPFKEYIENVNILKDMCLLVVSDIDKAAWSLSKNIDAMKIGTNKEHSL